jgi:hypothetical protein
VTAAMLVRKKPVTVWSYELTADNMAEARLWVRLMGGATGTFIDVPGVLQVYNKLEKQWLQVPVGHHIIMGIAGEFYGCDPEVFAATYESVIG